MIKVLKLQKAVIAFVLGGLALAAYLITGNNEAGGSRTLLTISGILLMAGALMALYPIIFSKKDKHGKVQLDPEKHEAMIEEENERPVSSRTESAGT